MGARDGAEERGVETVGEGGLWVVERGMRRVTVDELDGEVFWVRRWRESHREDEESDEENSVCHFDIQKVCGVKSVCGEDYLYTKKMRKWRDWNGKELFVQKKKKKKKKKKEKKKKLKRKKLINKKKKKKKKKKKR